MGDRRDPLLFGSNDINAHGLKIEDSKYGSGVRPPGQEQGCLH